MTIPRIIDPYDWDWFGEPWQELGLALEETRIAPVPDGRSARYLAGCPRDTSLVS